MKSSIKEIMKECKKIELSLSHMPSPINNIDLAQGDDYSEDFN